MSASVVGMPGRPVQTIDRKGRFSSDSNVHELNVSWGLFEITYRNLEDNLVLVFTTVNILDGKL